jgi:hypothetical protein
MWIQIHNTGLKYNFQGYVQEKLTGREKINLWLFLRWKKDKYSNVYCIWNQIEKGVYL